MNFKWTKEKCQEEALKYCNRLDYKKINSSSYEAARRNKWLDEICEHMLKPYNGKVIWTKEKCQEEALKYIHRIDFKNNSESCYNASIRNKWLDEICKHMIKKNSLTNRCIYVYEFSDNHAYIGLTYDLDNRHYRHMKDTSSSVFEHFTKTNIITLPVRLTDYLPVDKASFLEGEYINKYRESGWIILNKCKPGGIGSNKIKWTKERCHEEALKYNSKYEFRKNSNRAYIKAKNSKWLDEICHHIIDNKKDMCHEEALKYKSRYEFSKKSSKLYSFTKRNKWLDDVCSHMIKINKPKNYWTKERCYECALKCKNKKEFHKNYGSAYSSSIKNGWLNELFTK